MTFVFKTDITNNHSYFNNFFLVQDARELKYECSRRELNFNVDEYGEYVIPQDCIMCTLFLQNSKKSNYDLYHGELHIGNINVDNECCYIRFYDASGFSKSDDLTESIYKTTVNLKKCEPIIIVCNEGEVTKCIQEFIYKVNVEEEHTEVIIEEENVEDENIEEENV